MQNYSNQRLNQSCSEFLILSHPLTTFETQKYYQNEPKFNGVYSRDNFPEVKDRAYVINIDDFKSIGACWVIFYVNRNYGTYFDSFAVD